MSNITPKGLNPKNIIKKEHVLRLIHIIVMIIHITILIVIALLNNF